jgi:serine/threonine protein kinase
MSELWKLPALALRGLVTGACQAVGFAAGETAAEPVARFLAERFVNQGQRLTRALQKANDEAWRALEYSLAGESLWERCGALFGRADDRAFRAQVRAFLDQTAGCLPGGADDLRRQALAELKLARQEGFLRVTSLDMRQLAQQAGRFASYADPAALLAAERQALAEVAGSFPGDRFRNLRRLLESPAAGGTPLLTAAVRYFFRRAVEEDAELFQGLAFILLEKQSAALETGLAGLAGLMQTHGARMEELTGEVLGVASESYQEVLQISSKLDQLLARRHAADRELRPEDSLLSISEDERRLVRDLVRRYRALPPDQKSARVGLALQVGAAEAAVGRFAEAAGDFEWAAAAAPDDAVAAGAHASAFQAALAQKDFDRALASLTAAAALAPGRFSPFPLDKYRPERILGAGGFGAAFLCRHVFKGDALVVKALWTVGLDRPIEEVFNEARVLSGLNHPAVVHVIDCDFADRAGRQRPYVVMEYFDGPSLAAQVEAHGPFAAHEFLPVARQLAQGLHAAHDRGVFHRDVKPANVLVRRPAGGQGWQAKLIDFGLALRPAAVAAGASTEHARHTLLGGSIAGTWKYAAPEQLGETPGVAVSPSSDVYAFGRTCYFALLGTPEPDDDDKETLPEGWRKLLGRCAARKPDRRPASFADVLQELDRLEQPAQLLPPLPPLPPLQPLPPLPPLRPLAGPAQRGPWKPARPARGEAALRATAVATLAGHAGTVSVVAFSPDGRALVTGSFDDRLRLWDCPDGRGAAWLSGHGGDVNAAAFSPDGQLLASAGDDRAVRLWELPAGRAAAPELPHPDRVYGVAFSPDGKTVATACDDGKVRLWSHRERTGMLRSTIAAHPVFVRHVCFSPDGAVLATASGDRTVRLWRAAGGEPLLTLKGHAHTVWSVAFSPDGRYLASASQDATARVWDAASGRHLQTLDAHTGIVWSVAFSPDGTVLATASHDQRVVLWKMPEGRPLLTLKGHEALVRSVAFSPSGGLLATAGGDNTARLWLLHPADQACDWTAGAPVSALPPRPRVTLQLAGDGVVHPGDELWLDVAVENAGRGDLVRLRAGVESSCLTLRQLGGLFGRVRPGETARRCLSVRLPADHPPGEVRGELVFHEGNGSQPPPQPVTFQVRPFEAEGG